MADLTTLELGSELFNRTWRVTVDTIEVARHDEDSVEVLGHDVTFKVEKSLKPVPNTCELSIYNLSPTQRKQLEMLAPKRLSPTSALPVVKGVPVKIEAGYQSNLAQIWLGDLRFVDTKREGSEWVTVIETGDGEKAHQNARINISLGPKTPIETALRAMVRSLGVGEGNIGAVVAQLKINGFGKLFSQGITISGQASRELTDFARSADLEWSIQDGNIQFLNRGKVLDLRALLVSEDTGMLDSPTVDNDGILTVKMKMIPEVRVGGLLVIDAANVKGNYRIEKAEWNGSTFGQEWDVTCQARRY